MASPTLNRLELYIGDQETHEIFWRRRLSPCGDGILGIRKPMSGDTNQPSGLHANSRARFLASVYIRTCGSCSLHLRWRYTATCLGGLLPTPVLALSRLMCASHALVAALRRVLTRALCTLLISRSGIMRAPHVKHAPTDEEGGCIENNAQVGVVEGFAITRNTARQVSAKCLDECLDHFHRL